MRKTLLGTPAAAELADCHDPATEHVGKSSGIGAIKKTRLRNHLKLTKLEKMVKVGK